MHWIRLWAGSFVLAAASLPASAGETGLYAFQGGYGGFLPTSNLVSVEGRLYGTTMDGGSYQGACSVVGCGTIFWVNPKTGKKAVVVAFTGTNGTELSAGLIKVGTMLFGTATGGGSVGGGVVFAFDPANETLTILHNFLGGNDGEFPVARLTNVDGVLYGTTEGGGTGGKGTVFSVDARTGVETVVYAFKGGTDGATPKADVVNVGGTLYGTTYQGGGAGCASGLGCGTVFLVNPVDGTERVVYAFTGGSDGYNPVAGLLASGGMLYGTAFSGGATFGGGGTLFSLDPATRAETTLHSFGTAGDGVGPGGDLIDVGGTLYSTTFGGGDGANAAGTVFSFDPATRAESVVYSFLGGTDGQWPTASVLDVGGVLYGTTFYGGVPKGCVFAHEGCGTVFGVTP